MSQKTAALRPVQERIYKKLYEHQRGVAAQSAQESSNALETLLRLYLDPEAFAVLKRFHVDFDQECGSVGFTFRDALNELGGFGLSGLQRTLRRITKEQAP